MSFSSDWLALREPADARARAPGLLRRLTEWAGGRELLAVDLGCGTGSTWRALAPLAPNLRWRLCDNDPALLAEAARRTGAETLQVDLAADPETALEGAGIVTASALYDLVSADWIARFVAALPRGAALHAALTYDGVETWSPTPPHEAAGLAAFHAHQRGDKGFGESLGPDAAGALAAALVSEGWKVEMAPSPWRLGPTDAGLIAALAEGSADAVRQSSALTAEAFAEWKAGRLAATQVEVGHTDLLALPPG